ncbi:hypothetical protein IGI04_013972 [Brassica rapa subsp. trilocularis]|uniref:Uncharacterized protein n=1 Tax=Brassica rapa subsp. trilocularis TaxID=1813537 RepID=A0ABQ7NAC7_BRACM|nr:hypothetical protein IGI04_042034 [Brassica rapa subsp. trilocularis]KAG5407853.1 hypothetical protein IGI04_013972 [Brassica rapa subsp. trilocularis]
MDCGITTAAFVKIHGISDVKEMEYCKGSVFSGTRETKSKEILGRGVTFELRYSRVDPGYTVSFMPTDTTWSIEVAGDLEKSDGGAKRFSLMKDDL